MSSIDIASGFSLYLWRNYYALNADFLSSLAYIRSKQKAAVNEVEVHQQEHLKKQFLLWNFQTISPAHAIHSLGLHVRASGGRTRGHHSAHASKRAWAFIDSRAGNVFRGCIAGTLCPQNVPQFHNRAIPWFALRRYMCSIKPGVSKERKEMRAEITGFFFHFQNLSWTFRDSNLFTRKTLSLKETPKVKLL